jgi:hypothetical protein
VAGIAADLQVKFPETDAARIEAEVLAFLGRLYEKRVIECV